MDLKTLIETVSKKNLLTKAVQGEVLNKLNILSVLKVEEMPAGGEQMAPYLSAVEKSLWTQMGALISRLGEMRESFGQAKKKDMLLLFFISVAEKAADLAMRQRLKHLDRVEVELLMERVKKHRVVVMPNDEYKRGMKEIEQMNSLTHMSNDDVCNWAEITIENTCKICTNEGKEVAECALREIWLRNDIAPLYPDCEPEECPYQYSKKQSFATLGEVAFKKGA